MQETHPRLWSKFGAHPCSKDGQNGYWFRVWAPNAVQACIIGDFNQWNPENLPLSRAENGCWEGFVPGADQYSTYKYAIYTPDGRVLEKADPFAFHAETRPGTASKCYDLSGYNWEDRIWLSRRADRPIGQLPLNIYELHLGSWRRTGDGEFLSYRETARWLIPYVKELGFTHVKFLPVTEHPLDASLGYQCTGYFAPTSRFGTPHDFMYLVNELHKAGIGVLLDWVPTHFPMDAFGLHEFDGSPLYECALQSDGGICCSDFSRSEVCDFLIASAQFWLEEYHIDGLHIQLPSCEESDRFLQRLFAEIAFCYPDVLLLSDTMDPDPHSGSCMKWQSSWMHHILHYAALDPYFRQYNHRDLTEIVSVPSVLPLSHEAVTAGSQSLLAGLHGESEDKFSCLKALYTYMLALPGKKLLMMGSEFGQWAQWDFGRSLDWHLLEEQSADGIHHRQLHTFFKAANNLYLKSPALWQLDFTPDGFQWVCSDDATGNTAAFLRFDKQGNALLTAVNFSPVHRVQYRVGAPCRGCYEEIFNTDQIDFGGEGRLNPPAFSEHIPCHEMDHSLQIDLPPLGAVILRCTRKFPGKKHN